MLFTKYMPDFMVTASISAREIFHNCYKYHSSSICSKPKIYSEFLLHIHIIRTSYLHLLRNLNNYGSYLMMVGVYNDRNTVKITSKTRIPVRVNQCIIIALFRLLSPNCYLFIYFHIGRNLAVRVFVL